MRESGREFGKSGDWGLGLGLTSVSRQSRFLPLLHPGFLAALTVLLLNDHWLKRADLLPSVVTGKLSDFAGLIVAPIVAAVCLGSGRRIHALAFASVAGAFVLIKCSRAAADVACAVAGALGVPSQIWCDRSDLLALTVLPLAWMMLHQRGSREHRRPITAKLTLAVACVACVATSAERPPATFTSVAYVVNTRNTTAKVRIRSLRPGVVKQLGNCAEFQRQRNVSRILGPDAFDLGSTFQLDPDQVLSLGGPARPGTDLGLAGDCPIVAISIGTSAETLVWWDPASNPVEVVGSFDADNDNWDLPEFQTKRVALTDTGFTTSLPHAAMLRTVEPDACVDSAGPPFQIDFFESGPIELDAVTYRPEGCYQLQYHRKSAQEIALVGHACLPHGSFPFVAGDSLSMSSDGNGLRISSASTTVFLYLASQSRIVLGRGHELMASEGDCEGNRTACGYEMVGVAQYHERNPTGSPAFADPVAYGPGDHFVVEGLEVFIGSVKLSLHSDENCGFRFGFPTMDALVIERHSP